MVSVVVVIIVGIIFFILTKEFAKKPATNRIDLNKKKSFMGDLENHEAGLLVALMAKVAKADGKVSELEAELIKNTLSDISNTFENSQEIREKLKQIYEKEKENFANTLQIAKKYHHISKFDYDKRLGLMEFLLNLAFIDEDFSHHEQMINEDIASALKIKKQDYDNLVTNFKNYYANKKANSVMKLNDAYEILNSDPNDTLEQIKKQYRALVRQNHPDILMGKGKTSEEIKQATQKLQSINEAYELIKKHLEKL
ncbi:MAG: molecular chaperone DjlA [Proteobacteria bacterium]|nr:MAG: molecular chaperone DjlA [Pseudomonadota bacterium]